MSSPPWQFPPLIIAACFAASTAASTAASAQPAVTADLPRVEIVSVSPLAGLGVPRDRVPANVQTSNAADIERRGSLDLASQLNRTLASVSLNETQGNPFQPDLNFRGFSASPLLGTPQGLSVYLDGVRLNQPFGDVVSWDLIPRAAISSVTLMPGSNPLFGLNTLGGALAVQTKDGLKNAGSSLRMTAGAHQRAAFEFESGASHENGLNWFVTGNRFHEKGWRAGSPSEVRQLFAKLGRRFGEGAGATDWSLTTALAANDLTGNAL